MPITLTSWRTRAGLPGSGYQRIPQWTSVSASVEGSSRESSGLRMSASMKSVRSRSAAAWLDVDSGEVVDRRVALEAARELRAPSGSPLRR